MMTEYDLFLVELTKLTKEYGYKVEGCGCCDSPFLVSFDAHPSGFYSCGANGGLVEWNEPLVVRCSICGVIGERTLCEHCSGKVTGGP